MQTKPCFQCGGTTAAVLHLCDDCLELVEEKFTSTNSAMDEIALFEDIYELLCGVNLDKKDCVIAKVNARIVQLRHSANVVQNFANAIKL